MRVAKRYRISVIAGLVLVSSIGVVIAAGSLQQGTSGGAVLALQSKTLALRADGLFYETAAGRTYLPALTPEGSISSAPWTRESTMPDGHVIRISVTPQGERFNVSFTARPNTDIVRWGFGIDATADEYFTGLMERVVDGAQQLSWAPGITTAMNLRGKKIDMLVKPTTSVYAPFYLSSRGYAVFVKGTWPGVFDFAAAKPDRAQVEFEGPGLEFVIYTADNPAALVKAHAMDAGPPVLPPKWIYGPWRWRDEHVQRTSYYDGTPVTGPFNSEVMEDVLMMKAFGIPNAIYWIDRPWGPGPLGYDDFDIDPQRLPNFADMVRWLDDNGARTVLWIAPFLQGKMAIEGQARKLTLPGQTRPPNGQNYPLVDLTNPEGRAFWQSGIDKLLRLGVVGFKLDRSEENIPESGPDKVFDGRSIRENRNAYPAMFVEAAYEIARKRRGDDFVLMPRAAYTGSSQYGVFWGGDIGGTQEGLRASIVAVQRAAVMGYPNWGSDTCGYNEQLMEQEVCGRWLAFSALTPIMEVGPTRNVAFWNAPRPPEYDDTLIALWRMYARLHDRLGDYSYRYAQEAHRTGMPIVRPMFLVDPGHKEAWSNWWTYMYGPDLVVSPVWEKGVRKQQVYLPSGSRWRDAWKPDATYDGGQVVTVSAEAHELPMFVRVGSSLKLGDLRREWQESQVAARVRPNLKALEADVNKWFQKNGGKGK
ncbi:MAG TPA: TIM-barrel domain-containing protein [Terriglobia bacterium]|nr:TIM-barrel domain-containing protein [Terriglobia bacterium]